MILPKLGQVERQWFADSFPPPLLTRWATALTTSLIPSDFPDPGAPNTPIEIGFSYGDRRYSVTKLAIARKLSFSCRSAVMRLPNRAVGIPASALSVPSFTILSASPLVFLSSALPLSALCASICRARAAILSVMFVSTSLSSSFTVCFTSSLISV